MSKEEGVVKARRTLAASGVLALVVLSFGVGLPAAFAAPNPPSIDQTYPDPWITAADQPAVQGSMDLGIEQINVESSTDGVNYSPYCTVPTNPLATVWYCTAPTGTLAHGLNYLRATATDAVPETSVPGAPITITIVNRPTIAAPADGLYTNDYQPTFSGASDGTYFDVYTDDFLIHFCGGTVVNQAWNCTSGTIPDGDYTYLVETTFGATTIFSSTRTLHIDTVAPAAPTIDPIANPVNSSPPFLISGSAEENATVQVYADGHPVACPTGPIDYTGYWACSPTLSFQDDAHTLTATQTDLAGNVSALSAPVPLVLNDTTPPDFPTVTSPHDSESGGSVFASRAGAHPTISGVAETGATLEVFDGANPLSCTQADPIGELNSFNCTIVQSLALGVHNIYLRQTDGWGNSSGLPSAPQLVLTVTAPPPAPPANPGNPAPANPPQSFLINWSLSFQTDNPFPFPGDTVNFSGGDLPPGSSVIAEIHSDPILLGTTVVDANGNFALAATIPDSTPAGAHEFVVTVTDPEQNAQTTTVPVTVQPTPQAEEPETQDDASPGADQNRAENNSGSDQDTKQQRRALAAKANRNDPAAPTSFTGSLPKFAEILSSPIVLAAGAGSGIALLFFVALPAELVNSSLDENYERVFGRFRLPKVGWIERLKKWSKKKPLIGGIILTVLASFILSFSDPRFGFDLASLRLFISCVIATFLLGYLANQITSRILKRNWNIVSSIQLQPFGLIIALLGVIVSRVLDFAPGLLIGLILTLALGGRVSRKSEVKYVLTWAGVQFGLSIIGWIIYNLVAGAIASGSFFGALFDDTVAAIGAAGLSSLVVALLPITYFDGRTLFKSSKLRWAIVYGVVLIAFFVIVVGSGGLWGDINQPLWIWMIVFAIFSLVCLAIYWWFRTHPEEKPEPVKAAARKKPATTP
ncbi:MAG: hypothetical protein KIT06_04660, partial [Cryobacterium sp.]|nr:hypothetical protein [Cryobacterium sp.]